MKGRSSNRHGWNMPLNTALNVRGTVQWLGGRQRLGMLCKFNVKINSNIEKKH